jgi:peptidoglycan/LPS O-acetylase OafA/YrhL
MKFKVITRLRDPRRNSALDVYRGIAILSVVLFHFYHYFPYGYLGVDLFFVISGILIGGILTQDFFENRKIRFLKFILQRGFKIWPSFYAFIFLGTLIAHILYRNIAPDQIIPLSDMPRYLFFYQNYTGMPFHWSFDHVWSLCVEEHFYLILPLMLIVIQSLSINRKKALLYFGIIGLIVFGIVAKFLVYHLTRSQDTYSATHNRLDALAWGVLLIVLIKQNKLPLQKTKRIFFFCLGIVMLICAVIFDKYGNSSYYHKTIFQSIVPISFFMMIAGTYHMNISKALPIRIMGYYSYNWYLWHPIVVIIIVNQVGANLLGFVIYFLLSFALAMLFTTLIEEPLLKLRATFMSRVFNKSNEK